MSQLDNTGLFWPLVISLKNCSNFRNLMTFFRIAIYNPFWRATLLSLKALKASWSLHPLYTYEVEIDKSSCFCHHLHSRYKSVSAINWVLPPRTRLCSGEGSLKIACLLTGEMYHKQGIEKDGNGEVGGKFCHLVASNYLLIIRNTMNTAAADTAFNNPPYNLQKANA